MKFAEALLILLIFMAFCWAIFTLVKYAIGDRPGKAQWRVEEHTEPDGSITVELRKSGEAPRLIQSNEDVNDALADLRIRREQAELLRAELERKGS